MKLRGKFRLTLAATVASLAANSTFASETKSVVCGQSKLEASWNDADGDSTEGKSHILLSQPSSRSGDKEFTLLGPMRNTRIALDSVEVYCSEGEVTVQANLIRTQPDGFDNQISRPVIKLRIEGEPIKLRSFWSIKGDAAMGQENLSYEKEFWLDE